MKRFSDKNSMHTLNELNVTPLLDLAFVLLLIFMITTPQLSNDLDLSLPTGKAPAQRPAEKPKLHYVDVDPQGGLLLNRQAVKLVELPKLFAALKQAETDPSVVVRGADEVDYRHIVGVIDLLQQADITKVGLATGVAK